MRSGKVSGIRTRLRSTAAVLSIVFLLTTMVTLSPIAAVRASVAAQQQRTTTKRPLTHKDYESWSSIQSSQISR
jgi:hypothetical protein